MEEDAKEAKTALGVAAKVILKASAVRAQKLQIVHKNDLVQIQEAKADVPKKLKTVVLLPIDQDDREEEIN